MREGGEFSIAVAVKCHGRKYLYMPEGVLNHDESRKRVARRVCRFGDYLVCAFAGSAARDGCAMSDYSAGRAVKFFMLAWLLGMAEYAALAWWIFRQ